MIKKFLTYSVAALSLLTTTSSYGADKKYSIGLGASIEGFGINGRTAIGNNLFIGLGFNYISTGEKKWNPESNNSYAYYNPGFRFLTIPVALDYHPWGGGFKTSFSLCYNNSFLDVYKTDPKIGNVGTIKLGGTIVPAITIGYDDSLISDDRINFNFTIGLSYRQGTLELNDKGKSLANEIEGIPYIAYLTSGIPVKPLISLGIRFNI